MVQHFYLSHHTTDDTNDNCEIHSEMLQLAAGFGNMRLSFSGADRERDRESARAVAAYVIVVVCSNKFQIDTLFCKTL